MVLKSLKKLLRSSIGTRFAEDRQGAFAVMLALMTVPLVLLVGLGVDASRLYLARYVLQSSLDAGALAVGASYLDADTVKQQMEAYVKKNFDFANVINVDVNDKSDGSGSSVRVVGSADVETFFVKILSEDYRHVKISASTDVGRAGGGLMVSLVLDNTYSMKADDNIESLRDASEQMVQDLFGADSTPDTLRMGIVPFNAAVNPGAKSATLVSASVVAQTYVNTFGSAPAAAATISPDGAIETSWRGCVLERTSNTWDWRDNNVNGTWGMFWYPDTVKSKSGSTWDLINQDYPTISNIWFKQTPRYGNGWFYDRRRGRWVWGYGIVGYDSSIDIEKDGQGLDRSLVHGPNTGCPTPITPLTNDRATIDKAIEDMHFYSRGGTLVDIGLAWGLRVMSPEAPYTESTELDKVDGKQLWDSSEWRKAIVLMTDGDNDVGPYEMNGYGWLDESRSKNIFGTSDDGDVEEKVNKKVEKLCKEAKDADITIYTVVFAFDGANADDVKERYKDCASDPGKFFYAPDGEALKGVFKTITQDLGKLRITS